MPAATPAVQIKVVSYVKPSKPTMRHSLYVHDLDLVFGDLPYTRHLYFYKHSELQRNPWWFEDLCQQLKSSLASTLNHFYPLAGRVSKASAATRPVLDCNDEGVQFIEASLDASLTDFEDNGFPIQKIFDKMAGLGDCPRSDLPDTPFLCLQVTKLEGGGFALGSSMSHLVVDGHSFWHFLESWSKVTRGLEGSLLQPLHIRAILKPEVLCLYSPTSTHLDDNNQKCRSMNDGHGYESRHSDGDLPNHQCPNESDKFHELHPSHNPKEELKQVILHLPFHVVQQIKAMCSPGRSTLEALLAYLWQRLTMAQSLEPSQNVCLLIPINIRQRLLPPLTDAFYGNAVVPTFVHMTSGNLLEEDVDVIATRIHEAIACADDAYIKRHLLLESSSQAIGSLLQGSIISNVANSPKFPCYNTDFGWGKPIAVRPVANVREGTLDFYPSPPSCPNGSIDLCLALSKATLEKFSSLGSIMKEKI